MTKYDHEHPCPSRGCVDYYRRRGHDVPEDTECCICWWREQWRAQKKSGSPETG